MCTQIIDEDLERRGEHGGATKGPKTETDPSTIRAWEGLSDEELWRWCVPTGLTRTSTGPWLTTLLPSGPEASAGRA